MPKQRSLSDQIRRAIQDSGQSQYRIAKESGVDKAILSRFMSGERGLTLKVLDALTGHLGLRLCGQHEKEGR